MRKRILAVVMAVLAVPLTVLLALAPAASAAPGEATVSVVHGIPNTPVTVFVDGKPALEDFQPGTVAGPLQLPAGSHEVTVFKADDTAGTGTPVTKATADLQAGTNYSIVAHLTADGAPTLTPYVNDTGRIAAGQARLVVRHDAAAPAVDVRADGKVAFAGLTNPNEAKADLPAGSVSADVTLAGTSTVAIGPATLSLGEGSETIVYAVGSASDKTLSLVAQTITGLHSAPTGVAAGSGGLLDSGAGVPAWAWLVGSLSGLAVLLGGYGLVHGRRRRAVRS